MEMYFKDLQRKKEDSNHSVLEIAACSRLQERTKTS